VAIKTYLYSGSPVTTGELGPLLAIGANPVVGSSVGSSQVPITVDENHKDDLDEAMASLGYVYIEEYTGGTPLVGRSDYGVLAADPTGISPATGDTYYNSALEMNMGYDGTRGKWLSVESAMFIFGRDGSTAPAQYYRTSDGRIMSAVKGWEAPWDGTVISLAYTLDAVAGVFDLVANGASLTTVAPAAASGDDKSLDSDFNLADILAVRNRAASSLTSNVAAWMRVKWRSP